MRISKSDIGRLCLVKWDDCGRVESMILEVDVSDKEVKVYSFTNRIIQRADFSQIIETGEYVTPNGILESTNA